MANLPDIDTSQVGIIAFWNAEDHLAAGADTIDPTDCTGVFTSYSVYDNGLDGAKGFVRELEYGGITNIRTFNVRVKNDGWIAVWVDRTNTYAHPNIAPSDFGDGGTIKGYYDIMYDWFALKTHMSSTYSVMSHLIYTMYNSLSNKNSFSFSVADVGHYCYEFTNANVFTMTSIDETSGWGRTGYIQYLAGTTLYYAAVAAGAHGFTNHPSKAKFAGNTLVECMDPHRIASANLLAEGWMPSPLANYSIYVLGDGNSAKNSALILWS